jgi:FAD dependent oxidoreductase
MKQTFLKLITFTVLAFCLFPSANSSAAEKMRADIVVYGGTSGGVIAACQAVDMNHSVILIEPGKHLGGLTTGGLGATDIGNKKAIGGLSLKFYQKIRQHYDQESSWRQEKSNEFKGRGRVKNDNAMWTFEPHVAENIYLEMVRDKKIKVLYQERLDLKNGITKIGGRIMEIRMESGLTISGKMFIDATYEGDLMAKAGVSYHIGREANSVYGETLNGVQTALAIHHQFIKGADPYRVKGDPSSGLLPGVSAEIPEADGTGDHKVQAYCFRMCTTDQPENSVPWKKPDDYDPLRYELVLRNCEAGDHRIPWNPVLMPNRKTDTNNNYAISTDNIGMNYEYPDGDYKKREEIIREHLSYQKGLMWTLANNPRVPEVVRKSFQTWRLAKDEFTETDHWPHQLYIREARRMISEYVMTQNDCQGRRIAADPVGLAAYTMDSHNIQRYVKDGVAINEGDVQVGGFSPFPISYKSIRPRKSECENLLVPVCLSSSHMAFGSIRMEPVFMVLGQSSATAASLAIRNNVAIQDINYSDLKNRLLHDQQALKWTGPARKPNLIAKDLPGMIIDDVDAKFQGYWKAGHSIGKYVGVFYRHDGNAGKGKMSVRYNINVPSTGEYEVRISYTPNPNRATNVPVTVSFGQGDSKTFVVNQKKSPGKTGFYSLGKFHFQKGGKGNFVLISNEKTNGYVIADAIQLVEVK